jgi:hypothetical protein
MTADAVLRLGVDCDDDSVVDYGDERLKRHPGRCDMGSEFGPAPVRVAVVQAAPVLFDTPKTLQKLTHLVADAAKQGAELVVFPEAFVGGYPKGHDFGVTLGIRSTAGRDEFRRYFESAVEVPGPATEFIGAVARDHGIHLVVGVVERAGGTLYCTAATFGPDGRLLGKHRKLVPTALERVIWGRRRVHAPGPRHAARPGRVRDLLGELHAAPAHRDVRERGGVVLRDHGGRPGDVGSHRPAHRPGGPMLRPVGVPVPAASEHELSSARENAGAAYSDGSNAFYRLRHDIPRPHSTAPHGAAIHVADPELGSIAHTLGSAAHGVFHNVKPFTEAEVLVAITPERTAQAMLVRDIFGNPFRPVSADPEWLTPTVVALATGIYEDRAFDRMPILADALQDAECANADILDHCRGPGPHVRGCWVIDLLLGKT